MDEEKEFEQALFRFSLISPLLHLEDEDEKKRVMEAIINRELEIPYSRKSSISVKTIENYLIRYREKGFEGLKRKRRRDKDILKSVTDELLKKIVAFKKEEPKRSARQIIRLILALPEFQGCELKERTVSRILKRRGLTRRELLPKRIHRSFEMEQINDLWETDISEGPFLKREEKRSHLFAFIDDFSRIIPHAQFYLDEKLPRLEDCLKKAILKRGIPKAIYADNGKVFVSHHLKRICAELGIRLLHHLPYSPQSKGKIERFFLRVKKEFILEVEGADIQSLEELNSYFTSWLEIEYHRREHYSLGTTPLERFTRAMSQTRIRTVESMEEITEIFLYREKRRVHPKRGIIRLNGNTYQSSDAGLLGKEVEVRFDPYDMSRIFIYFDEVFRQIALPVSIKNPVYQTVPEENKKSEKEVRKSSMEFLSRLKQKEQELHRKESLRIDFTRFKKEG